MKQFLLLITWVINLTAFSQNTDTGVKQRLDSIIEFGYLDTPTIFYKTTFFYNEQENKILCTKYSWNDDWVKFSNYECITDNNQNPTSKIVEYFSHFLVTNGFVYPLTKNEYTYDANGNQTLKVEYRWKYENNIWVEVDKSEYGHNKNWEEFERVESTYDGSGKVIMIIENKNNKITYTYDEKGNIMKEIFYYRNDRINIWKKNYKNEYTYNINGKQIEKVEIVKYNSKKKKWEISEERKYTYNANGNQIKEEIIKHYNYGGKSNFMAVSKTEFTYDSNNNRIEEIYYLNENEEITHFKRDNVWQEEHKNEYVYDSNQNLIQQISYHRIDSTLKKIWKEEYVYNTSYLKENIIIPPNSDSWLNYNWHTRHNHNYMLIEQKFYYWESDDWGDALTYKYYYSPQTK